MISTILPLEAAGTGGSPLMLFLWLGGFLLIMYFFMIRPQQKRRKELEKYQNSLEKGTKVITSGGIYGTVKEVTDTYVAIEIDNNVTIKVHKSVILKDLSDMQK